MPELQIFLISSLKQAPRGPLLDLKKIEISKLYTFYRNTFHGSPSADSDCPFWQSEWERFLLALGPRTALSDKADIDLWCLGNEEINSECKSRSHLHVTEESFTSCDLRGPSCPPNRSPLESPAFNVSMIEFIWMKANSFSKVPLFKWTYLLSGR